jgi:hypothetical protein
MFESPIALGASQDSPLRVPSSIIARTTHDFQQSSQAASKGMIEDCLIVQSLARA